MGVFPTSFVEKSCGLWSLHNFLWGVQRCFAAIQQKTVLRVVRGVAFTPKVRTCERSLPGEFHLAETVRGGAQSPTPNRGFMGGTVGLGDNPNRTYNQTGLVRNTWCDMPHQIINIISHTGISSFPQEKHRGCQVAGLNCPVYNWQKKRAIFNPCYFLHMLKRDQNGQKVPNNGKIKYERQFYPRHLNSKRN